MLILTYSESSLVFPSRVSQFCSYRLILFCYLFSTVLRISQCITKARAILFTVL